MEAVRIGKRAVYMRAVPFSRRRLWLVRPAYDAHWWDWRVRSYKIAAHITHV